MMIFDFFLIRRYAHSLSRSVNCYFQPPAPPPLPPLLGCTYQITRTIPDYV